MVLNFASSWSLCVHSRKKANLVDKAWQARGRSHSAGYWFSTDVILSGCSSGPPCQFSSEALSEVMPAGFGLRDLNVLAYRHEMKHRELSKSWPETKTSKMYVRKFYPWVLELSLCEMLRSHRPDRHTYSFGVTTFADTNYWNKELSPQRWRLCVQKSLTLFSQ